MYFFLEEIKFRKRLPQGPFRVGCMQGKRQILRWRKSKLSEGENVSYCSLTLKYIAKLKWETANCSIWTKFRGARKSTGNKKRNRTLQIIFCMDFKYSKKSQKQFHFISTYRHINIASSKKLTLNENLLLGTVQCTEVVK